MDTANFSTNPGCVPFIHEQMSSSFLVLITERKAISMEFGWMHSIPTLPRTAANYVKAEKEWVCVVTRVAYRYSGVSEHVSFFRQLTSPPLDWQANAFT